MRKKIVLLLCILIGLSVFKLITTPSFDTDYVYNGNSNMFVFDDAKYTYNVADRTIISKATNEVYNFNVNNFNFDDKRAVYSDGSNVFFITESEDGYSIDYYDSKFNYHTLLDNNQKKKFSNEYIESLFSRDIYLEMTEDNKTHPNQFVALGRNIYICCNSGIYKYNLLTKHKSKIVDIEIGDYNFSYSNNKLYFTDKYYNVYSYDIEAKALENLKLSAYEMRINNSGMLFADLNNSMALSFYDFETKRIYVIVNCEISACDLDGEYIYYIENGNYYKSDLTGNNKTLIHKGKPAPIFRAGVNKYYIGYDGNSNVEIEEVIING